MRKHLFDIFLFVTCLAMLGLFGWHIWYGPRSLDNQKLIAAKFHALKQKHDDVRQARLKFEARVALLRPENVDPDLVSEMARRELSFAHPNDLIIMHDK